MIATVASQLQRATPESQGVASSAILQFVQAVESQIHELHSFMLVRHGKVIAEGWWSPYQRQHPHILYSLSKSFTSTAIGLAVAEGHFSVDDPVLSFFPDEAPAKVNDHLAAMQIRHLLSMSTGHTEDTMPPMIERSRGRWTKGFFDVPVRRKPGTHFLYNTGATYMLSAILQKKTGLKLIDYLTPRLFAPLGITNPVWEESPEGINTGGFGLSIRTEDIANFGQLYLQNGVWGGQQLVPAAWVKEATASHISNGSDAKSDWAQGYGYQFWRCRHNAYRGDGAFGQYCVVMPDQDAVLAVTSGLGDMQPPLNLVWDILLPAMQGEALPANPADQDTLSQKLSALSIAPVQGKALSPHALNVSGCTYQLEANELQIKAVTFNFGENGCTVRMKTADAEESITCGYAAWHEGQSTMFTPPNRPDPNPKPIVASGAWTADDTFTMVVRRYETPFYQTTSFTFAKDRLTGQSQINVWFAAPQAVKLVGRTV